MMTERTADEDTRICVHESAHAVVACQLFQRELVSVTVDPGMTKRGVYFEGQTRWQEPETGDLSIARLLKGKHVRIIRKRSSQLIDHFFRHAIDSLLISVAGEIAERKFLGQSGDLHGSDKDDAHDEANVIFQSIGAVKHLIIAAEIEAESILSEHRHLVLALAAELRVRRTMTGDQINEVIARANVEHDAMKRSQAGAAYARMRARERMMKRMRSLQR